MIVYWVYLNDAETQTPLLRPPDMLPEGAVLSSGLAHCELSTSVGYNHFLDLDNLTGLTGEESASLLRDAVQDIKDWGEAGDAAMLPVFQRLLLWAETHPDGVWRVE